MIRASKMPLAVRCRKSATISSGYGSEHSNKGSAYHELARQKVLGETLDFDGVQIRYGLTSEEMDDIKSGIYNINIQIPQGAIVFADDRKLSSDDFTGTPDLGIIQADKKRITAIDWKSGWKDVEPPASNPQLLTYAILLLDYAENEYDVEFAEIDLVLVLPKQNTLKAERITRDDLARRRAELSKVVKECESPDAEYTTGAHCNDCFGCMNCPAFAGEVKTLIDFMQDKKTPSSEIEDNLKISLPFAKAMGTVAGKIQRLAKAWVDRNGDLDLGGGQVYCKVLETQDEINTEKALDILAEDFQYDAERDVINRLKISKTLIKDLAAERDERGLYGKIITKLKDAEAITPKNVTKYKIMKGVTDERAKQRIEGPGGDK